VACGKLRLHRTFVFARACGRLSLPATDTSRMRTQVASTDVISDEVVALSHRLHTTFSDEEWAALPLPEGATRIIFTVFFIMKIIKTQFS